MSTLQADATCGFSPRNSARWPVNHRGSVIPAGGRGDAAPRLLFELAKGGPACMPQAVRPLGKSSDVGRSCDSRVDVGRSLRS